MLVGLGATRQAWSARLRGFIRDHTAGLEAVTVLDAAGLARRGRGLDVLVVDDATRIFGPAELGRAVEAGTVVIGLYGSEGGLGREWLEELGCSQLLSVDTGVAELVATLERIGPRLAGPDTPATPNDSGGRGTRLERGHLVVLWAVSGGAGLSETVIGLGEAMTAHSQVLVIEANPMAATLAARLRRDPAYGLAWALGRIGHGQRALPEGLSPGHGDAGPALGSFDVICASPAPGGPAPADPGTFDALVDEALTVYDLVVVEAGPLVGQARPGAGADRFAVGRRLAGRAGRSAVFAAADPEAAARLVEWKAVAADLGLSGPATAVFGRVSGRAGYEWSHLVAVVDPPSSPGWFAGVHRLPEDRVVARARWNGELVWRGKWRAAVDRLASELATPPPPSPAPHVAGPAADQPKEREFRSKSLAGEAGWSTV